MFDSLISQGTGDDLGATDMKAMCSGGSTIQRPGTQLPGAWTETKGCGYGEKVCGMRVKGEDESVGDKTGINRVQLLCCQGTVYPFYKSISSFKNRQKL